MHQTKSVLVENGHETRILGDQRMIDLPCSDPRDGLRQIVDDIARRLLPRAADRIGMDPEHLRSRLKVNLESSNVVNAHVHLSDDSMDIRITVNKALMIFYHKMLKVFVSSIGIGESEERSIEKPRIPYRWIVSTCATLIQAFWDDTLFSRGGLMLEELGQGQQAILERLVWSCECYDLAHEMGHVVRVLSSDSPPEYAIARKHVEIFLDNFPDLDDQAKLELAGPWSEELCADLIGLNLSLSQPNTDRFNNWANYKQWLYGGAEITHLLQMMLNGYYDRLHHGSKIRLVSSHPHDYLRWKAISVSPEKRSFSDRVNCGKMFGRYAIRVLDSILEQPDSGRHEHRGR